MSLRFSSLTLSVVLGAAFLLVASANGQEKKQRYVIVDGKLVPVQATLEREKAAEEPQPDPKSAVERPGTRSRVEVRDLRELLAPQYRTEVGQPGYVWLPHGFSYLPHSVYYPTYRYPTRREMVDSWRADSYMKRKDRERLYNLLDSLQREKRLLNQHEKALLAGLKKLKGGDAAGAIVGLTLAAKLNHGDPACRVHLAQARLAQGHYREAGLALRRALQLQPKLAYADLHLDTYYKDEGSLDTYTDKLATWIAENPARAEVHFLLGYLEFQRGDFAAAQTAFARVKTVLPDDRLTADYLEVVKPAREE